MTTTTMGEDIHLQIRAAISANNHDAFENLLKTGISATEIGPDGNSLFHFAKTKKKFDLLKRLLFAYDLTRIDLQNSKEIEPVFLAVECGMPDFLVKWIQSGLPLNIRRPGGLTLLHCAASSLGHSYASEIVELLISNKVGVQSKDSTGKTPLHHLVASYSRRKCLGNNFEEILEQFILAGVDINARDAFGRTALHDARKTRNYNCIINLLNEGADVNIEDNQGLTVFHNIYEDLQWKDCIESLEFRNPIEIEKEYYEPTRILIFHTIMLTALGLHVSERVHSKICDLKVWFHHMSDRIEGYSAKYLEYKLNTVDNMESFAEKCKAERTKLEDMELNSSTSMYRLWKKNDYELSQLVNKAPFSDYFSSEKSAEDFPIFHYLLQLQYKRGTLNRIYRPVVVQGLKDLNFPLTHHCIEHVVTHFKNSELVDLIVAFSSEN